MKQNEWRSCVNELRSGDIVTNVTGIHDGVGMVYCPGCLLARARVRVRDVSQVNFGNLRRKVNQAIVVSVEEVLGECDKKPLVC